MFKKGHTGWKKNRRDLLKNGKVGHPGLFKKGNTPWNKGKELSREPSDVKTTYERMESKEFDLVVKPKMDGKLLTTPDCDGKSGSTIILRPKKLSADPTADLKVK